MKVPIISPVFGEEEVAQVTEAIKSGWIASGSKLEEFEKRLAEYLGVKFVVTVNSGTAALEVALRSLKISKKEIITTATSCIPTANGIISSGNSVSMVDVKLDDYNIDVDQIEKRINKNTGAILPVHLYGRPAQIDKILEIGKKHDIPVIEDCAQSMGAKFKGTMAGSFGEIGCFSLNIAKIITTGEGGFIATDNKEAADMARIVRNYGRDPSGTDYCYTEYGYNFKFTNLQAAIGLAQLNRIDSFIKSRRDNAKYMTSQLKDIGELQLPSESKDDFAVHYVFPILLKKEGLRDRLKSFLEEKEIEARTIFRPMCDQPAYQKLFGKSKERHPNAEYIGKNGFYVGCFPAMAKEQVDYVAQSIREGLDAIRK